MPGIWILPPTAPTRYCCSAGSITWAQLRAEIGAAGFQVIDLVSFEGPAYLMHDLDERLASEADRRVVLETARALERIPELLGIGPHLLATAR